MPSGEMNRRHWLRWAGLAGAAGVLPLGCRRCDPRARRSSPPTRPCASPARCRMRALNDRPPCLETPWEYFRHDLTPNEAFYVRWHLQVIPTAIDTRTWRLRVGGVGQQAARTVARRHPPHAGHLRRRGQPVFGQLARPVHAPGSRRRSGATGRWATRRWTGVRLRDVLDSRPGLKAKALEVSFKGLDRGGAAGVPDYIKTLPIDKARDPNVLLAYAMNDQPLPLLNGFPLRARRAGLVRDLLGQGARADRRPAPSRSPASG